ncbi:MAG: fibronectin type III domain-containing protein, partial [Euzebyaceae bacterium]|nr:fibronectin type III domain-containing protein [Euzebyaceae bacterium]
MRRLLTMLMVPLLLALGTLPPQAATAAEGTLVGSPSRMWQTNGTVWALVASGGVLYVGGDFTSVRPPGAAPGTGEVARTFLAAFDATTGDLLPFSHNLSGNVRALAVSPDGTRLYAGGAFTTVDGVNRRRAVAFDLPSGNTVATWRPFFDAPVGAIATAGSTVYLGGTFTLANAEPRSRLAAVSAAGQLLPWTSNPDGAVRAMTMTPDGSRVIVGGSFSNVNGAARRAIVSLDAVSGEVRPWAGVIPSCSQVAGLTTAG